MTGEGLVRARGGEPQPEGEARWFIFAGHEMLVHEAAGGYTLPVAASAADLGLQVHDALYFGRLDGQPCIAAMVEGDAAPAPFKGADLRSLYGMVPEPVWLAAGLAAHLLYWAQSTRFCPRTGDRTHLKVGEWAMECPTCGLLQYPLVSPCIIVLIHDGNRVLLTRQASWPPGRYSLVAGFVEPGETLEQCLAREVREETGVLVDEMRYFASQAWPFPHQLMVGFTAHYAGNPVTVDHVELEDARWFTVDDLPKLPGPLSISRRIIDAHVTAILGRPPTGGEA